jgi:hypothetical protein
MTPEQRSGLARAILDGVQLTELAVQTQGDHVSGLLATAIGGSCASLPTDRISDVALLQFYPNPIFPNCNWDSEPRICTAPSPS